MVSFFDVLNLNTSTWDIIEFKLIVLFVTIVLAVMLGNYFHDKIKKQQDNDAKLICVTIRENKKLKYRILQYFYTLPAIFPVFSHTSAADCQ